MAKRYRCRAGCGNVEWRADQLEVWGVSDSAGYGATPRSKTYVSKINPSTHGFFITINSMILYFKHIIHIDDFLLNGHPPSCSYVGRIKEIDPCDQSAFSEGKPLENLQERCDTYLGWPWVRARHESHSVSLDPLSLLISPTWCRTQIVQLPS